LEQIHQIICFCLLNDINEILLKNSKLLEGKYNMSVVDTGITTDVSEESGGLVKGIDLAGATALVVGSMIGSGIFIAPSIMAGYIQSPGWIIALWTLAGVFTIAGAVSCAELSASMPKSGGQYVFIREAYSKLLGFLYGWAILLVIQTGLIAAVAVAFAKYLGVFVPSISENVIIFSTKIGAYVFNFNTAQFVAIVSIVMLTTINCLGVKTGNAVQKLFTFLKVSAVGLLIVLGFVLAKGNLTNFRPMFTPVVPETVTVGLLAAVAVAMSKALFAYDAWYTVTFASGEIQNPGKNLPKALIFGTLIVMLVYVATNIVYFYIVPAAEAASIQDNRIAAASAQAIFGSAGLAFIAAAIMISTFGCNNGLVLGGARVYYAMAKDKLFFKKFGEIHPQYRTPVNALILQGIWAIVLTMSGSYSDLLTYITFASVLFNVLTVIAVFIMRKKAPDMPRPYKVSGYPFVPIFYIIVGVVFLVYVLQGDLANSLRGLALILLGVPVYYLVFRGGIKQEETKSAVQKVTG
jgi:basic amino acid/polyamine antiporter, APA family